MTNPTLFGFSGSTALVGGEAGPEAILPLDRIQGYFDNAFENVMKKNQNSKEKEKEIVAVFNIDGKEFMRTVAKHQDIFDDYRNTRNTRLAY